MQTLHQIMEQVPLLTDNGIAHTNSRDERFVKARNALSNSEAEVHRTADWLIANIERTAKVNCGDSSYTLKHAFEKDLGYVSNGVFIAAAIMAGYPYELVPHSLNVYFGMSENSILQFYRTNWNIR